MRIYFVGLIIIFLLPYLAMAQEDRCAVIPYHNLLKKTDPGFEQRKAEMEVLIQNRIDKNRSNYKKTKDIIYIPVVVHILYNNEVQNVPDEQVYGQIWAMSLDFRKRNFDTVNTPDIFKPLAADCGIEFCLAQRTPDNQTTNGIVRVYTDKTEFQLDNSMKSSLKGGSSPWDPDSYLNLWVCNIAGNYLGYAQYPGGTDSTDGVVIDYKAFGFCANLSPHYNLGRTATHEVGHYFDLYHIWGDDFGSCDGSDFIDDTPNAKDANYYCPVHPRITSCNSTGEMFMNYMDYVYDECFSLYTTGQSERMHAVLDMFRHGLVTSLGCTPIPGIQDNDPLASLSIYPNPASENIIITGFTNSYNNIQASIYDPGGRLVLLKELDSQDKQAIIPVNGIKPGFYLLYIRTRSNTRVFKVFLN